MFLYVVISYNYVLVILFNILVFAFIIGDMLMRSHEVGSLSLYIALIKLYVPYIYYLYIKRNVMTSLNIKKHILQYGEI